MDIKPTVLVIEGEDAICNFIPAILASNQYQMVKVETGKESLSLSTSHAPDIVLLDLGLPNIDSTEALRQICEQSKAPVIVVSTHGHGRERMSVLDSGTGDYIVRPFRTSELLARIRTVMRHSLQSAGTNTAGGEKVTIRELEIDYNKRTVSGVGERIHLTLIEYKILVLLSQNAGKVLTRGFIIREVWGVYAGESRALRINMANIHRKIEANPGVPKYILTEMGIGYRMVEEPVEK